MNVATSFLTPQLKAQGLYRRPFLYHHWDTRHVWLREKFLQGALFCSSTQKENNSLFLHLHLLSGADITVQQRHILFFSTLVIKTLAGDSSCAAPHVVLVLYMDQSLTPQLSLVTTLLFDISTWVFAWWKLAVQSLDLHFTADWENSCPPTCSYF